MSNKVTFDYSKATSFVSENEVDLMKKITMDAIASNSPMIPRFD